MLFKDLKSGKKFINKDDADGSSAVLLWIKTDKDRCPSCPNAISTTGTPANFPGQLEVIEVIDGTGLN